VTDSTLELALRPLAGQNVLVGLSGGLDSTVLLHALATSANSRPASLRAVHVHHGLHADAYLWEQHCRRLCGELGVPLVVERVQVVRNSGKGLEASAREARYHAFDRHLGDGERLVLAHHQDDQAETVLLRLLRAAGGDGLAAMRPSRNFGRGSLVRPLLELSRAQLLHYAEANGLGWMEDSSNLDENMDRNFLRHRVLPALRERWPHAGAALARSAALLAEDGQLLGEEARKRLREVRGPEPTTLQANALRELERPWRARVLRQWLAELRLPVLPGNALAIIDSDLLGAESDSSAEYRWAGVVLRRWRGWLHVETQRGTLPADWRYPWDGHGSLLLPTSDLLFFARPGQEPQEFSVEGAAVWEALAGEAFGSFVVSARHGGERITLPGRKHSHALKQCLQDAGVPPWQRERLPLLLAADDDLLAAGDVLISARLDQFCRKNGVQLHWRQASPSDEI
jgi:tRNA(Ile)-lysidine synthase